MSLAFHILDLGSVARRQLVSTALGLTSICGTCKYSKNVTKVKVTNQWGVLILLFNMLCLIWNQNYVFSNDFNIRVFTHFYYLSHNVFITKNQWKNYKPRVSTPKSIWKLPLDSFFVRVLSLDVNKHLFHETFDSNDGAT